MFVKKIRQADRQNSPLKYTKKMKFLKKIQQTTSQADDSFISQIILRIAEAWKKKQEAYSVSDFVRQNLCRCEGASYFLSRK